MSDAEGGRNGEGPEDPVVPADHEPVGSVAEEAAKLFGVLSGWAKDQTRDQTKDQSRDHAADAEGVADSLADAVRGWGGHAVTDGEDCRYCPVCQVIHVVRHTSPEVRGHLAAAGSALMRAAAELLATSPPGDQHPAAPVEKIDLDSGADWDEDR